ncbi:MAG: hypothetical protein A2W97_19440 [Bacteroidetes bacterium GWE2_40_63]|nr:MAG: hypothetical protein A2W84_11245 [Bacteroidetes bacterium GWC2_40_13]OFX76045.1 MAG: hypothetical protein A2W96_01180 [Bacteroidetes bacterium GWD2_40_43]OFX94341.1 MAG: hypothetical protein A2W97_19440 [Bacteroidetes bacterium GWE2_40_63]OFY18819.1 MAG: hypothetical protein A2W88_06205 [Bacteroidetes bacterium GWF2_40_13]HBX85167.1 hypothetical protein [Marinilabiliales bacterium]
MRHIYISIILVLQIGIASSQNEVDALRYSQFEPVGTARFVSMGGAFGALGGDVSVMASNPAGIGVYRRGDMVFSMAWNSQKVSSDYIGSKSTATDVDFKPSNIGYVGVMKGLESSPWKYVNFGFGYNQLMDYQSKVSIHGVNPIGSILHYETLQINQGQSRNDNAYYLADAIFFDSTSNHYVNDYQDNDSYENEQEHQFSSSGYAGEYDFTFAANYEDQWFFGATVGFQRIRYEQEIIHSENPIDDIALQSLTSDNYLKTRGNGLNLKVGFIYKINQMIRLGGAFHTPTIYNFRDDFWTNVNARIRYEDGEISNNMGESPLGYFNWEYASPLRLMGSAAVVIGKYGTVSAEYEYISYSSMSLSSSDHSFNSENNMIDSLYQGTHNVRLGGELRFGILSVRGGFQYYGSPFKPFASNHDAYKMIYSGGIGLTGENLYVDLAYQYTAQNERYFMYNWEGSGADLEKFKSKYIAAVGFRF